MLRLNIVVNLSICLGIRAQSSVFASSCCRMVQQSMLGEFKGTPHALNRLKDENNPQQEERLYASETGRKFDPLAPSGDEQD